MNSREFFEKVAEMRIQQKAFFKARPQTDERKAAFHESKRLEAEIDNEIARVRGILANQQKGTKP